MSQRLTMARLVTLPANVVDLTIEVREEPVEEVVVIAVVVCDYFIVRQCYFFLFLFLFLFLSFLFSIT